MDQPADVGGLRFLVSLLALAAVLLDPRPGAASDKGGAASEAYAGASEYVTYLAGELPILLAAPHGSTRRPSSIPDRTDAVLLNDPLGLQLAWELADAIRELTGRCPHVVANHLHRSKLAANRPLSVAAQGNPEADKTWHEYHGLIEAAKAVAVDKHGGGHLCDLHSHGRAGRWFKLGFGLNAADQEKEDAVLDRPQYVARSSVRALVSTAPYCLSEVIRGPSSLGGSFRKRVTLRCRAPTVPILPTETISTEANRLPVMVRGWGAGSTQPRWRFPMVSYTRRFVRCMCAGWQLPCLISSKHSAGLICDPGPHLVWPLSVLGRAPFILGAEPACGRRQTIEAGQRERGH